MRSSTSGLYESLLVWPLRSHPTAQACAAGTPVCRDHEFAGQPTGGPLYFPLIRATGVALGILLCVFVSAQAVRAQGTAAASPSPQLRIETMESGYTIGSDIRFAEINDRSATLAGVYGGWVSDQTLFVGGGGYWLANREDDFKLAYVGPMVGVIIRGDRRVSFGARTLLGFGNATLSDTVAGLAADGIRFGSPRPGRHGFAPLPSRIVFEDDFFIAEPQFDATWRLTDWLRLGGGVGYRLTAGSDLVDDRVNGLSGSFVIQFGR